MNAAFSEEKNANTVHLSLDISNLTSVILAFGSVTNLGLQIKIFSRWRINRMNKFWKILWIVFNTLVGIILGWLISFGFLNLNNQLLIYFFSGMIGAIHAGVWFEILSSNRHNLRLKKIVIATQILVALVIGGLYLSQRFVYQNQPVMSRSYTKNFDKLWQAVEKTYPYFELKGVDWDQVHEQYYPLIEDAKNDQEYFETIAHMLGELEDAHCDVVEPALDNKLYASIINRGDLAIIDLVGYSGEIAGLRSGMLLLEVNGKSVEEFVPTIDVSTNNASTSWMRKIRAYEVLLAIPEDPDEILNVTVMDQDGIESDLEIKLLTPPADWQPHYANQKGSAVEWRKISDQIGYIRIDRLWNKGDDVVEDFDSALNELMEMEGLILDLRQNGGGDSRIGDKIAGRFMSVPFQYGQDTFRKRLYKFAWRNTVNYFAKPRGEIYTGKLVVLTDYPVMSSAEWLVGALVDSDRAISVGRVTGGATGNPIEFSLPGGKVRFSTASFTRPDGSLVEGRGYSPDIFVEWTVDDLKNNIDPDIQAGIDWIEAQK
jgi:C-terminal processing protease CtpA/Prc